MQIQKQILFTAFILLITTIMLYSAYSLRKTYRYRVTIFWTDVAMALMVFNAIYMIATILLGGKCPICWLGIH